MADPGLWTVIVGAVPGIGAGGYAIWHLVKGWRENRGKESWERREIDTLDRRRAQIDGRTDALTDRLESDAIRQEAEIEFLRYDRNRGWDTARFFESKAHDIRHAFRNAMHARQIFDVDIPVIPGLEDPYPARREKP